MIDPERGPLSIERQCQLLELSRSTFYYEPCRDDTLNILLMKEIDELYTDHPFYGSRRMAWLKQRHPELELHVFSNAALFDMAWPPVVAADMPHQGLLNLVKGLPGCTVHGTVLQKQLAREFMKSAILTYPSNIEETSCITVLEAQAAGCCVVTSAMGALEESVGGAGIIVREKPGSDLFLDKFTEAVDLLLKDDSLFQHFSQKAMEQSKACDWKKRAAELMEIANK